MLFILSLISNTSPVGSWDATAGGSARITGRARRKVVAKAAIRMVLEYRSRSMAKSEMLCPVDE
jgi:hypothetical protein